MADFVFKICLLGDAGVGKTSLVYRFIENRFSRDFKSTLGVNLLKKKIKAKTVDGTDVDVTGQIWDLGGQSAYKKLRKLYLEGSQGALLVFDITSKKSFLNLDEWVKDLFEGRGNDIPIVLIGNKLDLADKQEVFLQDAAAYAKKLGLKLDVLLTSAATGEGVELAFHKLIELILLTKESSGEKK
jgi:small GTP-binding protein